MHDSLNRSGSVSHSLNRANQTLYKIHRLFTSVRLMAQYASDSLSSDRIANHACIHGSPGTTESQFNLNMSALYTEDFPWLVAVVRPEITVYGVDYVASLLVTRVSRSACVDRRASVMKPCAARHTRHLSESEHRPGWSVVTVFG